MLAPASVEHGIKPDGSFASAARERDLTPFFDRCGGLYPFDRADRDGAGRLTCLRYRPRCLYLDLDVDAVDGVMTGEYRHMYDPEQCLRGMGR